MATLAKRIALLAAFVGPPTIFCVLATIRLSAAVDVPAISAWQFEELQLKTGRTLHGLIVAENPDSVDFMEIRRPPGRPMFLVMQWHYPLGLIAAMHRLSADQRSVLAQRIDDFKNRDEGDQVARAKIQLEQAKPDAPWHYASNYLPLPDKSPWLLLDSTAEEETTRRSIERVEQEFAAFREILPPRTRPSRPLTIRLFGTMEEYHTYLAKIGLRLQNPAVFVADDNLLAAGSELSKYAQDLALVRRRNDEIRRDYQQKDADMPAQLAALSKALATAGKSAAEQRRAVQLATGNWAREKKDVEVKLATCEKKNMRQFDAVTRVMFARLFHEAFHVYLDNYVYPHDTHDVPRWLNEGLAQIFESGQMESGTLRLDAPDAARLKLLQNDLRTAPNLPLTELLSADGSRFLVSHPGGAAASQRYYLYSWGLAYYLTFRQPLLETPALDRYVQRTSAKTPPIERFERLVGMPLDKFEKLWRAEMLKMKGDGK